MKEKLLTPQEAAAYLRMSVQFVRDHASELGAVRMGGGKHRAGRLRFHEQGLLRFIESSQPRRPNENQGASGEKSGRMAG
jgi:helix-turn-helix protein